MKTRNRRILTLIGVVTVAALAGTASAAIEKIPDDRIETALEADLQATRGVPGDAIKVNVDEGVATLTGRVDNILARERAVRVAKELRGVVSVIDRIDVRPVQRANEELRMDVVSALLADPATDSWEIGVTADDGKVKLTGSVDSYAERDLAEIVAKGVRGVRSVENVITVSWMSDRPDSEIQRDIGDRLRWDTRVDSGLVDVAVDDGHVTLSGAVGSAQERADAIDLAWVRGVRFVDADGLEVHWWARDEMKRNEDWPEVTDGQIRKAVERAFLYDPRVSPVRPQVDVVNGVVTLRGTVDSLKARQAAALDANNTTGVWYVRNFLDVQNEILSDAAVEQNVRNALRRDPYVSDLGIRVSAVNGKVYLNGDVASYFERAQAEDAASRAPGVVDVDNQIDVAYTGPDYWVLEQYAYEPLLSPYAFDHETVKVKSDASIKKQIESEFFWSPFVDGDSVKVEVSGGKATLTGSVDSWHERLAATENALEGGAIEVVNKLEIKS